jgi:hypothetical protein
VRLPIRDNSFEYEHVEKGDADVLIAIEGVVVALTGIGVDIG